MYVRCCLVEIAEKKCNGNCKCGKEILRCWSTARSRCDDGRISNDCSWLIPAHEWRLDDLCVHNNLLHYACVLTITHCVYIIV